MAETHGGWIAGEVPSETRRRGDRTGAREIPLPSRHRSRDADPPPPLWRGRAALRSAHRGGRKGFTRRRGDAVRIRLRHAEGEKELRVLRGSARKSSCRKILGPLPGASRCARRTAGDDSLVWPGWPGQAMAFFTAPILSNSRTSPRTPTFPQTDRTPMWYASRCY